MRYSTIDKQNDSLIRARQRVKDLKGFYLNIITYCLVIPFLVYVNYKTYWEIKWFLFSAIGWGIGIGIHTYRVYAKNPIFGSKWEKRKIEQYIRKEQDKH